MKPFIKKIGSATHYLTHHTLVLINALVTLFMLLGALSTVVPVGRPCILPYFGLFYPFWIVLTVCFLCYWTIRRKRLLLLPLATLLLCFGCLRCTFTLPIGRDNANDTNITLLTYNIFGLKSRKQLEKVRTLVFEQDADIVCLQEFGGETNGVNLNNIISKFEDKYPYHHIWYKTQNEHFWLGNATFSKYPIVNKTTIDYESKYNLSIASDIVVDNDTLRIINNHLESFKFTPNELAQFKDALNNQDSTLKHSTATLWRKMNAAYRLRTPQAEQVAKAVKNSPYPVVVCGDFNDVPQSYAYRKIQRQNLIDIANKAGSGYQYTYNKHSMLVKIDHILVDKQFAPTAFKVIHNDISDHYPTIGSFNIKK
ncbi:MAG: endonuclease/exonuclease/phosphatase family protein [Bacteroidales bacterium]|nr:endonuclease/exonuclease/phosphatase family protein [Bacteroidales bacterium]